MTTRAPAGGVRLCCPICKRPTCLHVYDPKLGIWLDVTNDPVATAMAPGHFIAVDGSDSIGPHANILAALAQFQRERDTRANVVRLHPRSGATRAISGVDITYDDTVPVGVYWVGRLEGEGR